MSVWLTIVVGLGAGAAGAIITTWGGQSRERRQARTDARDALQLAEQAIHASETAIDDDGGSKPPRLASWKYARHWTTSKPGLCSPTSRAAWYTSTARPCLPTSPVPALKSARRPAPANANSTRPPDSAAYYVANAVAELLTAATWHPWVSAPRRLWRTRQLSDIYAAADPTRPPPINRRSQEKQITNDAVRARENAGLFRP